MDLYIGEGKNEGKNMYMKIFWNDGCVETVSLKDKEDFEACLKWFSPANSRIRILQFDDYQTHYNMDLVRKLEFIEGDIETNDDKE